MSQVTYWTMIGTFYLLWMTWQDYTNNRKVDDRRNWFMMGLSISLVSHFYTTLVYKLVVTLLLVGLYYFMGKVKAIGEADINTFSWIFLGYALINPIFLGFYTLLFGILTLMYSLIKRFVFKYSDPVPFYGVILVSFVVMNYFLGFYW